MNEESAKTSGIEDIKLYTQNGVIDLETYLTFLQNKTKEEKKKRDQLKQELQQKDSKLKELFHKYEM